MAFKDTFKNIFNYFEIDTNEEKGYTENYEEDQGTPQMRVAPNPQPKPTLQVASHKQTDSTQVESRKAERTQATGEKSSLQRLHEQQQELMMANKDHETTKTTIDIKYPKRYEDATNIVNLLLDNNSVLIDFQYMSETQALRCLDYLDGARSVLSGNFKKVSSTMWLLTPVNVTVNVEELRSSRAYVDSEASFDFDMRR